MKKKKVVTFKVHKVYASVGEEKVLLHQLDPGEHIDPAISGVNDLTEEAPNSGGAQIKLRVTAKDALGEFQVGHLVRVTFEKH